MVLTCSMRLVASQLTNGKKLKPVGGHVYIYERRAYLSGRGGRGEQGRRGGLGGRYGERSAVTEDEIPRTGVAAANTTEIFKYTASTGASTASNSTGSERGGRNRGRFGPRRAD